MVLGIIPNTKFVYSLKGISVSGHWFLFLHFHGKMFLWQKIRLLIKNKTEQRTMKL